MAGATPAFAAAVTSVSWDRHPTGNTAITLAFDQPPAAGTFRAYAVAAPPRIVIVITGVTEAPEVPVLRVGNGVVERVRLGFHRDRRPSELHVVLDLASDAIRLHELQAIGPRLVALVGPGAAPSHALAAAAPTPTASPRLRPVATVAPSPTRAAADRRPSPAAAPPESRPPESRAPATDAVPPVEEAGSATAIPTPVAEPETASRVIGISATPRGDGSTLVLITADARMTRGSARVMNVSGDPPRLIVSFRGLSAPDLPRTLTVDDANLDRIRLIHDGETRSGELHIVLHLSRPGVVVADRRQVGANLVLQLGPGDAPGPGP